MRRREALSGQVSKKHWPIHGFTG
ncbi:unnamed protein product [Spirodela intermedia]|uniref:Uncharacterized protein n=1 Tax=Spirodela intermedia TaxID=51605 RepID=A0A7I8K5H8_SPIIN|nr:unnamed protein product [Spirodela intermedia]